MTIRSVPWVALVCGALVCCTADTSLTEIVVTVDSDIDALDHIVVTTDNFGAEPLSSSGNFGPDQPGLPRSIGLVHDGGPLGPVAISVRALDVDDKTLVVRHAKVFFVRHEVRLLRLELTRNCKRVYGSCNSDQTCVDGECVADEGNLEPWTGAVPAAWL